VTDLRFFARRIAAVAATLATIAPAAAQSVLPADYDQLARELDGRITFDSLPRRAEPGFAFDAPMRLGRAWLGERFAGQTARITTTRDGARFDAIGPSLPAVPLAVVPGPPGRNLSVAFHRGFGSNALFPLGPAGFPALAARGEGAVAVLFDTDQRGLGFRLHSDYPDPLGADTRRRGGARVMFFARSGAPLSVIDHVLPRGASQWGYRAAPGAPGIAGMLILNTDPGGIAIDDILYALWPLLG
jgi:hypothetical protein